MKKIKVIVTAKYILAVSNESLSNNLKLEVENGYFLLPVTNRIVKGISLYDAIRFLPEVDRKAKVKELLVATKPEWATMTYIYGCGGQKILGHIVLGDAPSLKGVPHP